MSEKEEMIKRTDQFLQKKRLFEGNKKKAKQNFDEELRKQKDIWIKA